MRKKYFKFLLLIILFTFISLNLNSYVFATGYNEFKELEIVDRDDVYLLVNNSRKNKNANLSKVKWKLFGPSVYVSVKNVKVKYKKHDIFSRSNRTSNTLEYEYTYTASAKSKITTDYGNTNTTDIGIKFEIISASIKKSINEAIGLSSEVSISKELNYTITVNPYSKVTMYVTGDGVLSQGAVKYYFFGIPIYKTNWEIIDILTEYYEFYEESYR